MAQGRGGSGGRTTLITGGTSGVGLAIARRLVADDVTIVLSGRHPDRGEAAVSELRELGGRAEFVAGDSADPEQVADVVARAVAVNGCLDGLVSAGAPAAGGPKPFAEMSAAELSQVVDSRLLPRILPLHAAIGALRESHGCGVLLATDAARHPTPGESVIGAVGAAVMLLTKAVARELATDGVRVNTLALTLTSGTPAWDRIFAREGYQKDLFTRALQRFPSGRAPTADEVAEVAAFLLSDAAGQVTGQTISVNGGLSFGGW